MIVSYKMVIIFISGKKLFYLVWMELLVMSWLKLIFFYYWELNGVKYILCINFYI